MNGSGPPFYGKFRATVTNNQDDQHLGRLKVKAQDIYGEQESDWAMPALPYSGKGVGLFLIPPKDASVWVEFEHGNPDYPIWSGCFWASGEVPGTGLPDTKILKTDSATITLEDKSSSSSIIIETQAGMKITMDSNGIEITTGSATVKLASGKVSINNDALEVM